jgi:4-amino-4-deoxy-L-arabinose transferase-like glycosyltransferase
LVLIFWHLGSTTLIDWDEAIHAQVSREMVQSGEWITPSWQGSPYFRKPPLFMWSTAVWFRFGSVSEFWARFSSALCGTALVFLTMLLGNRLYGRPVGLIAGAVLLLTAGFLDRTRFGTTDVMLTLFLYASFYAYLRLLEGNEHWWYAIGSALGLAVMVKSAGAGIGFVVLAVCLVLDRRIKQALRSGAFWGAVGLFMLIVVPWHAVMTAKFGGAFWADYLGRQVVERSVSVLHMGATGGRTYYLDVLGRYAFPWFYLLPVSILGVLVGNRQKATRGASERWLLLLMGLVVFSLFTLVHTKYYWYMEPIYPALAILNAVTLRDALRQPQSLAFAGLLLACYLNALLAPAVLVVCVLVLVAVVGVAALAAKRDLASAARWVGLFMCLYLVACAFSSWSLLQVPYHDVTSPIAKLSLAARSPDSADHAAILIYKYPYGATPGPTLVFYSQRPFLWVKSPEELKQAVGGQREMRAVYNVADEREIAETFGVERLAREDSLVLAMLRPLSR